MAQFLVKIITYFANEHLVKALAKNRAFQQVVLKIDNFVTTNQEIVTKSGKEYYEKGGSMLKDEAAKVHQTATSKAGFDPIKFMTSFKDEVMKDINKIKKQ